MARTPLFLFPLLFIATLLPAQDDPKGPVAPSEMTIELPVDMAATIPKNEVILLSDDERIESYLQGVVDSKYAKYNIIIKVRNGQAIITNLPQDPIRANKIIAFVRNFSSLPTTIEGDLICDATLLPKTLVTKNDPTGIWIPQSSALFPAQVANPRQICFSVGPRFLDRVGGNLGTAFTFGDQCPIYRWTNVGKAQGDLQLEVEAGAFCVFSHDSADFPMQNADYYAGMPLSYAAGPWSFRLRGYHVSSHLGDEYMEHHPHKWRRNKSFEAIDFFTAYKRNHLLLYGGPGLVVHSDAEMHIEPFYLEYGMELRGWKHHFTQLFGQPFFAMHFRNGQEHHFHFDSTFAVGYEWGKIQGFGRKIRLFFEFHHGYSPDGQFSRKKSDYIALRLAYGF